MHNHLSKHPHKQLLVRIGQIKRLDHSIITNRKNRDIFLILLLITTGCGDAEDPVGKSPEPTKTLVIEIISNKNSSGYLVQIDGEALVGNSLVNRLASESDSKGGFLSDRRVLVRCDPNVPYVEFQKVLSGIVHKNVKMYKLELGMIGSNRIISTPLPISDGLAGSGEPRRLQIRISNVGPENLLMYRCVLNPGGNFEVKVKGLVYGSGEQAKQEIFSEIDRLAAEQGASLPVEFGLGRNTTYENLFELAAYVADSKIKQIWFSWDMRSLQRKVVNKGVKIEDSKASDKD